MDTPQEHPSQTTDTTTGSDAFRFHQEPEHHGGRRRRVAVYDYPERRKATEFSPVKLFFLLLIPLLLVYFLFLR